MIFKPFRPYVYSDDSSKSLSKVVSPPFDTISPKRAEELRKSPTNIVHLTLPEPGSEKPDQQFRKWVQEGVLARLEKDSFLAVVQEFRKGDISLQRTGIIGLVGVFPDDGTVRPHEMTFEKPVSERVEVMRDLGGQPEPIFLLISSARFEKSLSKAISSGTLLLDFEEPIGVVNRVFLVESPEVISEVTKSLETESAIVADGHHRLEATRRLASLHPSDHFWSSCMSYVTSVHDAGLLIGGIHRVVKRKVNLDDFMGKISEYFDMESITSINGQDSMVIYRPQGNYARLIPKSIPPDISARFHRSIPPETYVLNELLFKTCLGFSDQVLSDEVVYQHDLSQALESVDKGEASFAVLMPYWNKNTFIQLIMGGDRLPQKSTYFYPKIPSGIAINMP